jgi:hypothetical protein
MSKTLRPWRLMAIVFLALWATGAPAQTIVSGCPGGNWSAINQCQWLQIPVTVPPVFRLPKDGDVASIAAIQGTFTLDVNSPNLSGLFISSPPGANGTFLQPGFTLRSGSEGIGPFGTFSQTGGANIIGGNLALTATYNLQGANATLSANTETIDQVSVAVNQASAGLFTQNGGTNTLSGALTLGSFALATNGAYNLNGGQLSAADETVGAGGAGTFSQTGGTNTANTLSLGLVAGGSGIYDLAGGTLSAVSETVGDSGSGSFVQGGNSTNTVSGTLTVAANPAGGAYDLQGGTLNATTIQVNLLGSFKFDGGTTNYSTLNLAGGTLSGAVPIVNNAQISGFGTINASGGFTNAGSVSFSGGAVTVSGTMTNGAGATMSVAGDAQATFNGDVINSGTFSATGTTTFSGQLTNNAIFINNGNLTAAGVLTNLGTFSNNSIASTAFVTNAGIFNNSGSLTAATFTNSGTFNNFGVALIGAFTNNGAYVSDPAHNQFQQIVVGSAGYLSGLSGDIFTVTGNFQNLSTQNTLWSTGASQLDFTGGGTHTFDLAGQNGAGFSNNFAWGSLVIDPGNTLDLAAGSGDALYAFFLQGLNISGNTITNIDGTPGLFLYYDATDNPFLNGNYNLTGGGELIALNGPPPQTPEPSTWFLMASGLGLLVGRRRWRAICTLHSA